MGIFNKLLHLFLLMELPIETYLQKQLAIREQQGNKRALVIREKGIDFLSNDYLGFASSIKLKASKILHHGSTGSRLLSGNSNKAMVFESFLASFHEGEAALLFNSGYDANIGLIGAIANRHTCFLYDEYCHASMIDGMRLSHAKHQYKFVHNDLDKLESLLKRFHSPDSNIIVLVESIYSMQGDAAPLKELACLCANYNAALIVDEAHANGIIGKQGQGMVVELGLQDQVFARTFTFGKALGTHGGAVIGSETLKQYLINFARSFIYSTALSPADIDIIWAGYGLLMNKTKRKKKLLKNIQHFNLLKKQSALQWQESYSPIQSLIIGNNDNVKAIAQKCLNEGMHVGGILSPTVAKGSERLRICLHSYNTESDIYHLFNILQQCQNELSL